MKDIILEMNILFQKSNQISTVFINDRDQTTSELPSTLKQLTIQPTSKFNLFGFKYRKIVWLMDELQETPHPQTGGFVLTPLKNLESQKILVEL